MIAILDYGLANLRSVQKAVQHVAGEAGASPEDVRIVSNPADAEAASHLVLPGVGALRDAMVQLREAGQDKLVRTHIEARRPFLGICLGLQMLFDVGFEHGEHACLGVLPGEVVRFDVDAKQGLKVPHMGWNTLNVQHDSPLTADYEAGQGVYFVHSYHAVCGEASDVATTTDYGGAFVSSVRRENVMATQFHPEKSQAVGLSMLREFLRCN